MFYSQFILAKKGPLGTIWIAAHLERKLRKNQVADTDIGVSVDSILFPEVPIALRLSSHLLLGVVRIYSRKVNYLFDDCSEALLKIKQAFRSTAVDLPPEESTAPYHSITLPETFDLDDFELPDNDIFQGNYVDHHVSTREQITLQDTMEGVVYSTSKFGLDERFGDGDTSQIGLDLDEDLFLDKVGSPRHDEAMLGSDADPQEFVQPMTPLVNDQNIEGMIESSEVTPAIGNGSQIDLAANTDFMEYAQAPSTPGLIEESNLANVQEALACDDHLEAEDHNSTELKAKDNQGNASSESDHHGDKNAMDWSLINANNSGTVLCTPAEENGHLLGGQEINQVKPQGDSPSTAETVDNILSYNAPLASLPSSILDEQVKHIYPVSECSGTIISVSEGPDRAEDLQNGVLSNKEPSIPSTDQTHAESVEPQGIRLDGTVASPSCSYDAPVLEDPCNLPCSDIKNIPEKSCLTNACQPVPEGVSENYQASLKPEVLNKMEIARNVVESCSPSNAVESNAVCLSGSPGGPELEKTEAQACQEPKNSKILNSVHENMYFGMPVLQACNSHANQPEMLSLGGNNSVVPDLPSEAVEHCSLETSEREEAFNASGASTEVQGCHATDVMKPVLESNQISEPASCEDIEVHHDKLDEQVDNAIPRDTQFENLNSSASSDLPAPEKLLSVPEGRSDLPNNMLVESTPDKEFLAESEEGDAGSKIISGKKRSFTESTLTLQGLNSVASFGLPQSKRTAESIPDDDDLLSSILVGRRTSVLKMKPTPPLPEVASTKRFQSAPRGSASKRKVLMDDTMVLHGDTIRQQLTSTEDIRRVRKKAACTRPEVWMIQKQFLEDEIFSEPISTGMSTELICLYSQTYDLSGVRVSQNDENSTSFEAAEDMEFSVRPNDTKETGKEGSTEPLVIRNDGKAQPAKILVQTENQMGEDHVLGCQGDDTQVQMKSITDIPELKLSHELLGEITEMEIDGGNVAVADSTDRAPALEVESSSPIGPVTGDIYNVSTCPMDESAPLDKTSGANASLQMDASCLSPDHMLETQSVEKDATVVDISNGKCVDAIEVAEINDDFVVFGTESKASDEFLLKETEGVGADEVRADVNTDCSAPTDNGNPSLATVTSETVGCDHPIVETGDQAMEETRKNELGFVKEDEVLVSELGNDDKNPASNCSCSEEPKIDSLHSVEFDVDAKSASFNGENPSFQDADPQSIMNVEITAPDHPAVVDRGESENVIVGQDTEFLNVDDDDLVEENDDYVPSAEETRFLENSGWSSRTRAVAKYLQTLFDKEAEQGRKVLPMDNLLAGKTRKEASRMFFETLVLKTRDYIHVEQENPCDNIHIKPRLKLMKSDF